MPVISCVLLAAGGAGSWVLLGATSEAGGATGAGFDAITRLGGDGLCCQRILHHNAAPKTTATAVQRRTSRMPGRLSTCCACRSLTIEAAIRLCMALES